jgi:tripartite-type tricarboxylate transporter receptor subunit TctC
VRAAIAFAAAVCWLGPASAQDYPTHPVTIVVPFAAGGGNDAMARLIALRLGPALGQQFVVENRPGAGGNIGARAVAHAAPDGYTLLVGNSGVFGVGPSLYANAGFDPRKDFAAVGLIASFQQVVVVHPSLPIHSIAELVAYAKQNPGKLTYASAGIGSGSHISTELRDRIEQDGGETLMSTPEQHAADIDADETKWGGLVRKLGLRAE